MTRAMLLVNTIEAAEHAIASATGANRSSHR
jgi:hypothetical protein